MHPSALFRFFATGTTLSYQYRKAQLDLLEGLILRYEPLILEALKQDLGKGPEESYLTELGFVLHELRSLRKKLKSYMKPRRVPTNLVNLPGSSYLHPQPLGVVLIIAPWNYPFQLLMAPLAGAIAAGNTVLLKPSEMAPATAAVIHEMITEHMDPEAIQCVLGNGAALIPALMKEHRFDHVFFTGSTAVGQKIYALAAEKLVPVTLELGGKSPVIVAEDADLKVAARRIVFGKMINAGQTCVAPDYLLVHASVAEALKQEIQQAAEDFYGKKLIDSPEYGRIINDHQYQRLKSYLSDGHVAYGGTFLDDQRFLSFTLLTDVPETAPIMKSEIFGPLLPVFTFRQMEEAMDFVRRYPHPLSLYLFSAREEVMETWARQISFGGGCFNNTLMHLSNEHLPFGGVGWSGMGSYHGSKSFEVFSHMKSILKSPVWLDPAIKYPPFRGRMGLLKKLMG